MQGRSRHPDARPASDSFLNREVPESEGDQRVSTQRSGAGVDHALLQGPRPGRMKRRGMRPAAFQTKKFAAEEKDNHRQGKNAERDW